MDDESTRRWLDSPVVKLWNVCDQGHEWVSYCGVEHAESHIRHGGILCFRGATYEGGIAEPPDLSNACLSRNITTSFIGITTNREINENA